MNPDVLERLRARLDAGLLPVQDAALHRPPLVSPDGRELTAAEALAWRAHGVDAELGILIEIGREPRGTLGIPDLQPVPLWIQVGVLAAFVALLVGQGFLGFLVMILWLSI